MGSCHGSSCSSSVRSPMWCSMRSEEHTSELQSPCNLVCRLLLEKKKKYMLICAHISININRKLNSQDEATCHCSTKMRTFHVCGHCSDRYPSCTAHRSCIVPRL